MTTAPILDSNPQLSVCADWAFDSPLGNRRMRPLEGNEWNLDAPQSAEALMRRLMAGYQRPSMNQIRAAVRSPHDAQKPVLHFLDEFIRQLDPLECDSLMRGTDASPREIAALLRHLRIGDPLLVTWINQYASDPNWRDSEALTVCLGEWYRVKATVQAASEPPAGGAEGAIPAQPGYISR